jgi:hypothetical protein
MESFRAWTFYSNYWILISDRLITLSKEDLKKNAVVVSTSFGFEVVKPSHFL